MGKMAGGSSSSAPMMLLKWRITKDSIRLNRSRSRATGAMPWPGSCPQMGGQPLLGQQRRGTGGHRVQIAVHHVEAHRLGPVAVLVQEILEFLDFLVSQGRVDDCGRRRHGAQVPAVITELIPMLPGGWGMQVLMSCAGACRSSRRGGSSSARRFRGQANPGQRHRLAARVA